MGLFGQFEREAREARARTPSSNGRAVLEAAVADAQSAIGGAGDHAVFAALRSLADVVLVAAGTVRAERYGPAAIPIAIVSRSCLLEWDSPFFTAATARAVIASSAWGTACRKPPAGKETVAGPNATLGWFLRLCIVASADSSSGSAASIRSIAAAQ